jgi:hypothetical protein
MSPSSTSRSDPLEDVDDIVAEVIVLDEVLDADDRRHA